MPGYSRHFGRPAGLLAAAALALAACSGDGVTAPGGNGPGLGRGSLSIGLEASALDARTGETIAVTVTVDGETEKPVLSLQGYLKFDPARLEFAGQAPDGETYVALNESAAARGELRLLALNLDGIDGSAAQFVFRVKDAGYAAGLRFALEEAADQDGDVITDVTVRPSVGVRAGAVPEAKQVAAEEWNALFEARGAKRETGAMSLSLAPGDGLVYGDVNLSSTITSGDVTYLGGVAVGNTSMTNPATNRDAVIAGNVTPNNGADGTLVGFGDPCRPGVGCTLAGGVFSETSSGDITGADVAQVAQEAVGTDRPVVGVAIPGRIAPGGLVAIPAGSYSAADCSATPGLCNWTRDNVYRLDGIVQFGGGATLTIQEGTRIEGNSGINPNALYIRRDGRIIANGSALAPIVFTCSGTKARGCWGGVAIAGNASVNEQQAGAPAAPTGGRNPAGGGNTRILEGPAGSPPLDYGGTNDTDDSGVFRYVVIEYAGFIVGTNNELNGLTLGAVGSGTTIDHVQIHGGLDDGIEFFGGTVNVSHLLLTANSDDAFDWSFGYNGSAQFVIIQADSLDGDKGLEGDNTETVATYNNLPRTTPKLYNFTLVGSLFPTSTSGVAGNNVNDAVHMRRGNRSQLANFVVMGYPSGLDIDDLESCTGINTDMQLRSSLFAGNGVSGNADSDPACPPYAAGSTLEQQFLSDPANANLIEPSASGILQAAFDVMSPDFRPAPGGLAASGAAPAPAGNTFIQTVSYRGAVPPATSTTFNNISWYMGWTRGWTTPTAP